MSNFMIETPHTKAECVRALDELVDAGGDALAKYEFGCLNGDHTGYALVEAENAAEALKLVPRLLRPKAKIIPVDRLTPDTVMGLHAL